MRYEKIIEAGSLVEVRVYNEPRIPQNTEEDVKKWFDLEKNEGYEFLKCYKESGKVVTLFIKEEDYAEIIKNLK